MVQGKQDSDETMGLGKTSTFKELIIGALKHHGGQASRDQIFDFVLPSMAKKSPRELLFCACGHIFLSWVLIRHHEMGFLLKWVVFFLQASRMSSNLQDSYIP